MNIPQAKSDLRREMRARLGAVTQAQRGEWSSRILDHLTSDVSWLPQDGVVAMFGGLHSEPDLLALLPWLNERGVRAAFFAIGRDGVMTPHLVRTPADLARSSFGVFEPVQRAETVLEILQLNVILVPGLAFGEADGSRLGRGKGYYDRVLGDPGCRARAIGVCFALQCRRSVPHAPHDAAVRSIVTERGWQEISAARPS